jgi:membrane protein implicated in regulation of membrane protease activity
MEIWVWLGVTVLSLVVEFTTFELASLWFAAGGIVAMILAACNAPLVAQLIVFIAISLILLLSLRKIALKFFQKGDNLKTNTESVVGNTYRLLSGITKDEMGTIKINGVVWNVVSDNGEAISKGEEVEIVNVKGNKYIVKKGENK